MDVKLICFFILSMSVANCIGKTVPSQKNLQQNALRNARARFPFFGSLFGQSDKESTTTKPLIDSTIVKNDRTESNNNAFNPGLWNYFGSSVVKDEEKNQQGPHTYYSNNNATLLGNNSYIYQTGENYGEDSIIYTFENNSEKNENSGVSYFSNASAIDIKQNASGTAHFSDGSIIYTIQNQTDSDGSITNLYESGGTYGSGFNNKGIVVSSTKYKDDKLSAFQTSSKFETSSKPSFSIISYETITNDQASKTDGNYNKSVFSNTDDNPLTESLTYLSENSNIQNVANNKLAANSIYNKNISNFATNLFLESDNKFSATDLNSNYLNNKKDQDTNNNLHQDLLLSKITSTQQQIVPNALSSSNVKVSSTSSSSQSNFPINDGDGSSNQVIVICTDPITGSVIGKYESSSILQEYKDAMVEKDGLEDWAAIGDNSTSLSLPAQLIVKNISMTIRGKIHYCQIINIQGSSVLQGTSDMQAHPMNVNTTNSNTKDKVSSLLSNTQVSDQFNGNTNTNIINNPVVSTITSETNLISNDASQNNKQTTSEPSMFLSKLTNNTQSNSNFDNTSSVVSLENNSHVEISETSSNKEMFVIGESSSNSDTESTVSATDTNDSGSLTNFNLTSQSKNNTSVLFESRVTASSESKQNQEKNTALGTDKDSKESEESNKKQELFISHHAVMTEEHASLNEKDKTKEPQKVTNQGFYVSTYLGHKHSNKDKSDEKIYYSKNPYFSTHEETPYYSMHVYHHSIEEDSKFVDSGESKYSGIFISKPVKIINNNEENKNEEYFVKIDENEDSDDDISSDFEKINKELKYPVFSFG